jgi:hypothetical protein
MWGGKYAARLNLLYMQGIKHIYLVNYRPKLLLNKMQGKVIENHLKIVHIWHENMYVI